MDTASNPSAAATARGEKASGLAALDGAAVSASMLCIVHCLAMPLVIAALPGLAVIAGEGETLHLILLLLALPMSGVALIEGRRRGGPRGPLLLGIAGLVALASGLAMPTDSAETGATVAGGVLLIVAHVWNWRARLATAQPRDGLIA